jgi:hypothetical protein
MKKLLLVIAFLLVAVATLVTFPCYNRLFAVDGCCKRRASLTSEWGRMSGASFTDCENLNRKEDNDNVLDRRGLVWWDVQCR